ncbi:MAG: PIN domain nuclease [Actinobacteria bacterium ATB1]|nr:PIN domain nuclease [Actinobacteria bacterium ATB1]
MTCTVHLEGRRDGDTPGSRNARRRLDAIGHPRTLRSGFALDRNDRRVIVLLARAAETDARVTVPATALAQAIRRPDSQARLARLVRQPTTDVVPLDRVDATSVGMLLAACKTIDIVDAHVVVCARRGNGRVVTSDPEDLRRLDPSLQVVAC